jgi:hypothetical protein
MLKNALFAAGAFGLLVPLIAANPDRDFSGTWRLDRTASAFRELGGVEETLTITQNELTIECATGQSQWIIPLDGSESKYQVRAEKWTSASKWEGPALLINTLVSGPRDYTIMDRWELSRDHAVLSITRQVMQGTVQSEGHLVYRRPTLERRPEPAAGAAVREYVVPAGTRILLEMVSSVDTKHSREGDRVYLQTSFPVVIEGRTVIPKGSNVTGTVGNAKRPGRVAGKGEIYVRFDELTLPNGVTRDFRSRIGSADSGSGEVDRKEGTIRGTGDRTGDARTVGTGAGVGATVGGVAGRSMGAAGIGGAAGAAAGLAGVLVKRGPDPSLPRGTQVEMVLDRDLHYRADELPSR